MLKNVSQLVAVMLMLVGVAHAQDTFVYRTPQGVSFTVTKEGLSSIRLGERELARGTWGPFNGDSWFKEFKDGAKVKFEPAGDKTLTIVSERMARVRQIRGEVVATSDYSFDGEDATISTRLENNNPDLPLNVPGFSGLKFTFDRLPTGVMNVQHSSYFQFHGVKLCHPSHWSPIGGSYATDSSVGIGVSPWKTGWNRTLILWDYADWNPGKRENVPERNLIYFAAVPVPPRGAATYDLKLRVSPNRDWKHLLEPYREHFQKTFGPVRYKADNRWIATDYLNHSQSAISAQNPYGFHGGFRRIDTPEGAKSFAETFTMALQDGGGQGTIVWGQGGDDPRGVMYRPDFDILPPEVEANWSTIVDKFKIAKLKFGVATRPADIAVRRDWKSDTSITINPDDDSHFEMLWHRFETMNKRGCTLFYLDSFGSELDDVKLMKRLREKMGDGVLTFAEHQCDALLPFSGGYSETTLALPKAGQAGGKAEYQLWSVLQNWEIYRYLAPGAQMAARLYLVEGGKMPPGVEEPERFFYRNGITPLLPASDFARRDAVKAIQPQFVDSAGQWKP